MDYGETKRIVIATDLDYFFAQCEVIRHPEFKERPVVVCVYSGRTHDSGAVSTANYVARSFGVKSGIPIVRAKKLLEGVPEAVFLPVDPEYYEAISGRVFEVIREHGKKFERASIDEAFIDVSSESDGDYNKALQIANSIKSRIQAEESLTSSVGVAPNKLLAKMAAESKKPDGLVVLKPDQIQPFLKELPLRSLVGIGPKIEDEMRSLGILTVFQLSNFDESKLVERFGRKIGLRYKSLARGIDDDPVTERDPEQYSRIITLKEDARTFSFSDELAPLAEDISNWLKDSGKQCRTIGIIYVTSAIKLKNKSRTLESPTDSIEKIVGISQTLFEEIFAEREKSDVIVRRIGIRVSNLILNGPKSNVLTSLSDYFEKT